MQPTPGLLGVAETLADEVRGVKVDPNDKLCRSTAVIHGYTLHACILDVLLDSGRRSGISECDI